MVGPSDGSGGPGVASSIKTRSAAGVSESSIEKSRSDSAKSCPNSAAHAGFGSIKAIFRGGVCNANPHVRQLGRLPGQYGHRQCVPGSLCALPAAESLGMWVGLGRLKYFIAIADAIVWRPERATTRSRYWPRHAIGGVGLGRLSRAIAGGEKRRSPSQPSAPPLLPALLRWLFRAIASALLKRENLR